MLARRLIPGLLGLHLSILDCCLDAAPGECTEEELAALYPNGSCMPDMPEDYRRSPPCSPGPRTMWPGWPVEGWPMQLANPSPVESMSGLSVVGSLIPIGALMRSALVLE